MKSISRKNRHVRRGSAVVEAAVFAPLMMTAMLGMLEVGYAFMVKQTVILAAREGCRSAALPGGTSTDVQSAVDATMSSSGLEGYSVDTNVTSVSSDDPEVWVKVSIPFDKASFTGDLLGGGTFEISSKTTMRREGNDSETGGDGVLPES